MQKFYRKSMIRKKKNVEYNVFGK